MKLSTWQEDMDDEVLIDHLLKRKGTTEDLLKFVKDWPTNGTSYISDYRILAIRYGEARLEAELKWIEESIQALQKKRLPAGQDLQGISEKLLARRRAAMQQEKERD